MSQFEFVLQFPEGTKETIVEVDLRVKVLPRGS